MPLCIKSCHECCVCSCNCLTVKMLFHICGKKNIINIPGEILYFYAMKSYFKKLVAASSFLSFIKSTIKPSMRKEMKNSI